MQINIRIRFKKPRLPRLHLSQKTRRRLRLLRDWRVRTTLALTAFLVVASLVIPIIQPFFVSKTYALGNAEAVLPQKDRLLDTKLVHKPEKQEFQFNEGYFPGGDTAKGGGPKISAVSYEDPKKGLSVTDPYGNLDFSITPEFGLLAGRKDGNRVVYPLRDGTGWLVYTMQAGGVKEDVVLRHANGDRMTLTYKLGLGDEFAARLNSDGSVGIYGSSSPIAGYVSTSSDRDAELLRQARKKAKKDKLFFSIPAPIAYEAKGKQSSVAVHFELEGDTLKTVATGLKKARYPLSIDPTVTVTSTSDLFRDINPESNVDLDITTGNMSRGAVTGGVIPAWSTNANNMGTARFLHSSVIYDDYAYVAGGAAANSASNITTVEFARLSSVNASIGTWSTTTALPTALSRFQLLAYNGYLYAIGGATATTGCGTVTNTVYYNRIQTNGQLSGTWNTATNLPASLCGLGAVAYNGTMYVVGGRTGSTAASGVNTAYHATILPDGNLSSWTTDDSVIPAGRYDHDLHAYNGHLYVVGGNQNGTLVSNTYYAPIAGDGSIYGTGASSWKQASTSFNVARSNMGSRFSGMYDGYMYVQGGCQTFNATFSCTAVRNEIQVAQINADGSLGPYSDVATSIAALSRVGNSISIWRGTVYSFAGCTGMNSGTISCATGAPTLASQSYSTISTPGQVGPVNTTTALPTGVFAHGAAVLNGRIYIVGGCVTNSCQTGAGDTTGNVSYATINADGTVGSWTTDVTNRINGATGLAAMALTTYNDYLIASGGYTFGGASAVNYRVKVNPATGALTGAWGVTSGTTNLSAAKYYASSYAYAGFVYVFGGCTGSAGQAGCTGYSNTVNRFTFSPATGTFSNRQVLTNLPVGKALMAPAFYNGYIYLVGGATGASAQTTNTYYARINSDGTMGAWNAASGQLTNAKRRADAVAMNGYLYVFGGHNGATATTYGDIEIGKIDLATGNIPNNFTNSVIQITPRWDERAVFANGYMYATGGCSSQDPPAGCTTRSTLVEYVEVFNAGNKGATTWAGGANTYATNRGAHGAVAHNGYLYVAGGCTSFNIGADWGNNWCNTGNDTTAYAPLNPDGTIGAWTTGPALPATRSAGCMVAMNGYLYFAGGEDGAGNSSSWVFYSQIGANGVPGAFAQTTTSMPVGLAWFGCATFNNRIYVTGGLDLNNSLLNTVYYSPSLPSGGNITSAWTAGTSFTDFRQNHSTVVAGGYLYVIGGDEGGVNTTAKMDVQFAQLNPSTGAITGSWTRTTDLPKGINQATAVAANGYIYLSGGRIAPTSCLNSTYIASVNSTGQLSDWSLSANSFTTARFGAKGMFYNGYYYLTGGHDCTNLISTNVIQQAGAQSQAMKGLLSKYADLNGDGTPRAWVTYLTNAVNNGVDIEKWQLKYRSSAELANSWGATTTISPVTSQATYPVSALNGSGTDIKLSRWFWFSLEMNMEQSFTFTDDTRPTIYQYELHYSPPPSKRLMHGRDFRDQTQQGLDASPM